MYSTAQQGHSNINHLYQQHNQLTDRLHALTDADKVWRITSLTLSVQSKVRTCFSLGIFCFNMQTFFAVQSSSTLTKVCCLPLLCSFSSLSSTISYIFVCSIVVLIKLNDFSIIYIVQSMTYRYYKIINWNQLLSWQNCLAC